MANDIAEHLQQLAQPPGEPSGDERARSSWDAKLAGEQPEAEQPEAEQPEKPTRTFSQAEVNEVVERRLRKAQERFAKQLAEARVARPPVAGPAASADSDARVVALEGQLAAARRGLAARDAITALAESGVLVDALSDAAELVCSQLKFSEDGSLESDVGAVVKTFLSSRRWMVRAPETVGGSGGATQLSTPPHREPRFDTSTREGRVAGMQYALAKGSR